VTLGAAHHGVDAAHQLVLVEGLGHVVVGAAAEALDLCVDLAVPDRIMIGVLIFPTRSWRSTSRPAHVGQVEVEQDQIVVIDLAEIDSLFARSVV
jgi:hypothetical protein